MSKNILITGASSDFGLNFIKRYSSSYDVIIAHFNHSKDELENLKETLGSKLHLVQADLSDENSAQRMIDEIKNMGVDITHILHLPSSNMVYNKLSKLEWCEIQKYVDIQVKSAFLILKEFLPKMAKEKYGHVVLMLTSCTCDVYPPKYNLPYVSSKYMLLGMMKSLAVDFADKNVTINAVSPSMTQTKFLSAIPRFVAEKTADEHPLKRLATVEDIIPMIQFLLSDDAGYITGQNILISGGV